MFKIQLKSNFRLLFISAKDMSKAITSLKNPKNPLPKKRQLMRVHCGDYRTKMTKEEQNFSFKTNVSAKKSNEKSIFLKKHDKTKTQDSAAPSTSGFKFNFSVPKEDTVEEMHLDNPKVETEVGQKFKMNKSDNSFRFNFGID